MNKSYVLLTSLLVVTSNYVNADDYFDPALLATTVGKQNDIDLSIFSNPGGGIEGEREVKIYLNDIFYKQTTLDFKNNSSGVLEPVFPDYFFDNQLQKEIKASNGNITVSDIYESIPYSKVSYDQSTSRIDISIPQAYLAYGAKLKSLPSSWDSGVPSFLVDYRITGNRNIYRDTSSRSLYGSGTLGFNFYNWRLRTSANYNSYTAESINRLSNKSSDLRFYNTYIERDIGELQSTIQFGELSTNGMISDSFGFTGGRIYSNDDMLKDDFRMYSPTIRGIANTQAVVTVKQDNRVVLQVNVPPGPFELTDVSLSGYSGDLVVQIREADGKVHGFVQPFSTLPEMRREGAFSYEIAAGRYGDTSSSRYYNEIPFIYGSLSRGFSGGITLYNEGIFSRNYQLFNMGSTFSLGQLGAIAGDTSLSRSEINEHANYGQSYGIKYSKSKVDTGTTVTLATYKYATRNFYSFNDFAANDYYKTNPWNGRLKNKTSLNVVQSLNEYGSFSVNASQQEYWNTKIKNRSASLSHSFNWHGIYISNSFSLDQSIGYYGQKNNKSWSFNASIPINVLLGKSDYTQSSIGYTTTVNNNIVSNTMNLSGNIPDTKVQYRLSRGWGNNGGNRALSLNINGDYLDLSAGYSYTDLTKTIDYGVSGGAVFYPWNMAFTSDSIINGGAVVDVGGVSGIKVYQGGETSIFGTAIVPSLQPYKENRIDVNTNNLPDNIVIKNPSKTVIPEKGAIVKMDYKVFKGYQVVFHLQKKDGSNLPFGSIISLSGDSVSENTGIVDGEGRVYMAGIPSKGTLLAFWGEHKKCEIPFILSETQEKDEYPIKEIVGICES